MASAVQGSRDWLRSPRTNLLAWWIPQAGILTGLVLPVPVRAAIWITALIWMGTACIHAFNSRSSVQRTYKLFRKERPQKRRIPIRLNFGVIGLTAKEADIVDSTHLVLAAVGQSLLNFSSSQSFAPLVRDANETVF